MSSFLSAAESVARQQQNIQPDLKKMEEESRVVELALDGHNCYFWSEQHRKMYLLQ